MILLWAANLTQSSNSDFMFSHPIAVLRNLPVPVHTWIEGVENVLA
jgi:hypothetical protein